MVGPLLPPYGPKPKRRKRPNPSAGPPPWTAPNCAKPGDALGARAFVIRPPATDNFNLLRCVRLGHGQELAWMGMSGVHLDHKSRLALSLFLVLVAPFPRLHGIVPPICLICLPSVPSVSHLSCSQPNSPVAALHPTEYNVLYAIIPSSVFLQHQPTTVATPYSKSDQDTRQASQLACSLVPPPHHDHFHFHPYSTADGRDGRKERQHEDKLQAAGLVCNFQ